MVEDASYASLELVNFIPASDFLESHKMTTSSGSGL